MKTNIKHFILKVMDAYRSQVSTDELVHAVLTWASVGAVTYCLPGSSMQARDMQSEEAWKSWVAAGLVPQSVSHWVWHEVGSTDNDRWKIIQSACLATTEFFESLSGEQVPSSLDILDEVDKRHWLNRDGTQGSTRLLLVELAKAHASGRTIVTRAWDSISLNIMLARAGLKVAAGASCNESGLSISDVDLLSLASTLDRMNGHDWSVEAFTNLSDLKSTPFILGCFPMGVAGAYDLKHLFGEADSRKVSEKESVEIEALRYALKASSGNVIALTSSAVLFKKGHHQDFRKDLINTRWVKSISMLPSGAFPRAMVSPALVVFGSNSDGDIVMSDVSNWGSEMYSSTDQVIDAISGKGTKSESVAVPFDAIDAPELLIQPSRYLNAVSIKDSVLLGDLVELLRSPPTKASDSPVEMSEISLSDLSMDSWLAINAGSRSTAVESYRAHKFALQSGDLVLSVKATIGKAAIYVSSASKASKGTVIANTCIALRPKGELIPPKDLAAYLLIFMRSKLGQMQLESLSAGAVIKQLSLRNLLDSYQVPTPSATKCKAARQALDELASRELSILNLRHELDSMAARAWESINEN